MWFTSGAVTRHPRPKDRAWVTTCWLTLVVLGKNRISTRHTATMRSRQERSAILSVSSVAVIGDHEVDAQSFLGIVDIDVDRRIR